MELPDYNYTYDYSDNYMDNDTIYYSDNPWYPRYKDGFHSVSIRDVVSWIVVVTGLLLTVLAIILCLKERKDHVAPVYVINLLVSNLLQICCIVVFLANIHWMMNASNYIYMFGVAASSFFMILVATDRYLFITSPQWFQAIHPTIPSVVVSVVVWLVSFVFTLSGYFSTFYKHIFLGSALLIPFPLLIFFLVGSVKAMSKADHISSNEKKQIAVVLVLLLLIYMMMFLPLSISLLAANLESFYLSLGILIFNPLADLIVFVFMRKETMQKLVCVCAIAEQTA